MANYIPASPFSSLGLSLLIHKMEHAASMSSKPPICSRPEHSSLVAEASEMGWSQREGEKLCLQDQEAPGPGEEGGQKAANLVLCPPPQLFLPQNTGLREAWLKISAAQALSIFSPERRVGAGQEQVVRTGSLKDICSLLPGTGVPQEWLGRRPPPFQRARE